MNEVIPTQDNKHFSTMEKLLIGGGIVFVVLLGTFIFVWAQQYNGRISPNVSIGPVDVSGLDQVAARNLLEERVDTIITKGLPITAGGETKQLALATLVTTDLIEYVQFKMDESVQEALAANHSNNPLLNAGQILLSLVKPTQIELPYVVSDEHITEAVYTLFPEKETLAVNASYAFAKNAKGWDITTIEGTAGVEFQFNELLEQLDNVLTTLEPAALSVPLLDIEPMVSLEHAEALEEDVLKIVSNSPYELTHTDERDVTSSWFVNAKELEGFIEPTQAGITINQKEFDGFADKIAEKIDQPARNAKLELKNGRVSEFVESKNGVAVDRYSLFAAFSEKTKDPDGEAVKIATFIEQPAVKTGDVNDLGITEILGTGTSSYAGSPLNRRRNIQNGVDLLNGILIPPGEEFSLIESLKPFTFENGYLPELVIKGDKIEPELGGGLCQIGTTTFRATMNSGLPVTQRRNHSLVVNYYNDPKNGNPGTDATIYEPNPDYRFKNDTESHVLFQAENLVYSQELRFTFWGTSDGREGSYEAPVVTKWIPAGETRYIETTDLEPGVEKCQGAHTGANAYFNYTIARPDGTEEVTTYTSHYRPLPEICLVGVEELSSEIEASETEEGAEEKSEESPTEAEPKTSEE